MDMRKVIGSNVLSYRLKMKLTQEALAERSGFSQQYLSELENGKRNPSIVAVYELATGFGISHLDLLRPTTERTTKKRVTSKRKRKSGKSRKNRAASGALKSKKR